MSSPQPDRHAVHKPNSPRPPSGDDLQFFQLSWVPLMLADCVNNRTERFCHFYVKCGWRSLRFLGLKVRRMADGRNPKSWLRLRVEKAVAKGTTGPIPQLQVNPQNFCCSLRTAYRLPVSGYHGVYSLEVRRGSIRLRMNLIRGGMNWPPRRARGFRLGGLITIILDLGILSAHPTIAHRFRSSAWFMASSSIRNNEIAELWIAAASAAGVDISRELLEKGSGQQICPARHPADCRPRQR